jgi:hypothetical protein
MKIRNQIEVIGRDVVLTLQIIECLRVRANRKEKRKQWITRLMAPFTFLREVAR